MTQNKEKIKKFESLSFEEAMSELEKLVSVMESGNMKLDEMIQKFEDAQLLSSVCQNKLNELKQKVEILTKDSAAGQEWKEMNAPDE